MKKELAESKKERRIRALKKIQEENRKKEKDEKIMMEKHNLELREALE